MLIAVTPCLLGKKKSNSLSKPTTASSWIRFKVCWRRTLFKITRRIRREPDEKIKRLKFSEPHKSKKKSNKDQKLSETLQSAKWKVKNDLEEGEKLISERQKYILLADKSDYGWANNVLFSSY